MDSKKADVDIEELGFNTFEKKELRVRFIRRVYAILTLMLLADAGCVAVGLYVPVINHFLTSSVVPLLIAGISFIVLYGVLVFSENARRRAPYNYIMMAALTFSAGYVMAAAACRSSREAILVAALGTSLVTLSVTMMAVVCPCDFTNVTFILFVGGISVTVGATAFVCAYTLTDLAQDGRLLHVGISTAFVFLFALYLAYDTQMVLGGLRHQLKPDEYVHGALHLWVDITLMFLSLFQISYLTSSARAPPLPEVQAASTSAAAAAI